MVDANGQAVGFTILLNDPSLERVSLPYVQNLRKLGLDVRVRTVDPAQYQQLTDDFDFDMTMMIYTGGDIPGNELRDYWSCTAAKSKGSAPPRLRCARRPVLPVVLEPARLFSRARERNARPTDRR